MTNNRAMVFQHRGGPLVPEDRQVPSPAGPQVLIRVQACGVCRTDLHVQDGELADVPYPVVPGHQVVGEVTEHGPEAVFTTGQRVGATWLAWTCGSCGFCSSGRENLCKDARFHGYQLDGGYADFMLADSRYCLPLDGDTPSAELTPLLCAGLIGYRTLRLAGDAHRVGIYGFGSAAHLLTQVARAQGREVYAFTRPGDVEAQRFASELGAVWSGDSSASPPVRLDAALIFAPVGALVPKALSDLERGGRVVCGGIHMSDIPSFPYAALWEERQIRSVANLTREDGREFMNMLGKIRVRPQITTYPLGSANDALDDLRTSAINGTAVLTMDG